MLPADQRLHARGAHVTQCEGRLVGEEELFVHERIAQVHLEFGAFMDRLLHARLEHREAILPFPLRAVHGDVRLTQQLRCGALAGQRNPDAGANGEARVFADAELE